MKNGLIVRADDFGSAHAADEAILEALQAGYLVRNVSCMAVGATIEESAPRLAKLSKNVNIGLHFTLNAEWDTVKWKPCMPPERIPTLLDSQGNFYQSREALAEADTDLEQIQLELDAQLERLRELGLPVTYVDAHMGPDVSIPGLADRMNDWAAQKGLLYVRKYYKFPPAGQPAFAPTEAGFQENLDRWLDSFVPGEQYTYVMHPAKLSEETIAFSNRKNRPGAVAWERELEYRSTVSPRWLERVAQREISLLRYRDARIPG